MSIIVDNKTKTYGKITISKYKKSQVIDVLNKIILTNNFDMCLYFFTELHASGNYDDIWNIIFKTMLNNIHILNYRLPFFLCKKYNRYEYFLNSSKMKGKKLDIRNISEMRADLFHIVRILTFSPKEDLSKYIPKCYYSTNEDSYDVLGNVFNEKFIPKLSILKEVTNSPDNREIKVSMKQFKYCIVKILKSKSLYDRMREKDGAFFWLSRIITYSFQSSNIVGYPNNIGLYNSYDINDYDNFIMQIWNILLLSSKVDKLIFKQIGSLYKLFVISSKDKKNNITFLNNFVILALLYLTDRPIRQNKILDRLYEEKDHRSIHMYYANIQNAISNGTQRVDYIQINKKSDKVNQKSYKSKKTKSRKKKERKERIDDKRLQLKPDIILKCNAISEKEKKKLEEKINIRYDTSNLNILPNIQNETERENDIKIVDEEQKQLYIIENEKFQQKIKDEIQEERYTNYEQETSSLTPYKKNKLFFIKDDSIPNIFRLITFKEESPKNDNIIDLLNKNIEIEDGKKLVSSKYNKQDTKTKYDIYKV